LVETRTFFASNEIYRAFLLNSRAQGVSGKNEQPTETPWRGAPQKRGAQCSCIGCIGLRPTLVCWISIHNKKTNVFLRTLCAFSVLVSGVARGNPEGRGPRAALFRGRHFVD